MSMMTYDEAGEYLEHQGLTDEEIDAFFEHQGVKGMKWGVRRQQNRVAKAEARSANSDRAGNRNNARAQRNVDRAKRLATGTASKSERAYAALFEIPVAQLISEGGVKGASAARLDSAKRLQTKITNGKAATSDILNRIGGVDYRELNFDYTP